MAFCTQCGNRVGDADRFCGKCGAPQPAFGGTPPGGGIDAAAFLSGVNARTASLLCYIPMVGWIAAIVVLAAARFRHDHTARFNAFQGLYLFVVWLIVEWVVTPMFLFPGFPWHSVFPNLLKAAVLLTWIFMLVKVSQGETYRLPVIGELAERSVSEQV
jgi:uncharacterized membrane protein